ncbi:MAG: DUF433 domain-containing protein [Flavobacteriales bacterium]
MTQVFDRITVDPSVCGGRPCVRGMRIRVSDVLDLLASGLSAEQVLVELPGLGAIHAPGLFGELDQPTAEEYRGAQGTHR